MNFTYAGGFGEDLNELLNPLWRLLSSVLLDKIYIL
jgi:hypothetical protein